MSEKREFISKYLTRYKIWRDNGIGERYKLPIPRPLMITEDFVNGINTIEISEDEETYRVKVSELFIIEKETGNNIVQKRNKVY